MGMNPTLRRMRVVPSGTDPPLIEQAIAQMNLHMAEKYAHHNHEDMPGYTTEIILNPYKRVQEALPSEAYFPEVVRLVDKGATNSVAKAQEWLYDPGPGFPILGAAQGQWMWADLREVPKDEAGTLSKQMYLMVEYCVNVAMASVQGCTFTLDAQLVNEDESYGTGLGADPRSYGLLDYALPIPLGVAFQYHRAALFPIGVPGDALDWDIFVGKLKRSYGAIQDNFITGLLYVKDWKIIFGWPGDAPVQAVYPG